MNIKFIEILKQSKKQLEENFYPLVKNSIIYPLLLNVSFVLFSVLVIMLLAGATFLFIANNVIFGTIILILGLLLIFFVGIPLFYLSVTLEYIIAKVSVNKTNNIKLEVKRALNISNIKTYIIHVMLPTLAMIITIILLTILMSLISIVLIPFTIIIMLMVSIVFVLYLESQFFIPLYLNENVAKTKKMLKKIYTSKQIFIPYIIQYVIFMIASSLLKLFALIPLFGVIIYLVSLSIIKSAVVQAFIVILNSEMDNFVKTDEVIMRSENLDVKINHYGAELKSIKANGNEYLWQADAKYWARTSPVLFPFVGKLKDDKYTINGEDFYLSQHGFLRDRVFALKEKGETYAIFEYTSTLADYELYPYDFTVNIKYELAANKLKTTYNVINNDQSIMYFQIGAHPAFNVDNVNDLQLEFTKQNIIKHNFINGLQQSKEQFELSTIDLSYDLINENIPCFSDFEHKKMTLKNNDKDYLKFDFTSMEYLAIWSPEYKNAKFVCIEPWNGICSHQNQDGYSLENKEGMNTLKSNETFECSYEVEIC